MFLFFIFRGVFRRMFVLPSVHINFIKERESSFRMIKIGMTQQKKISELFPTKVQSIVEIENNSRGTAVQRHRCNASGFLKRFISSIHIPFVIDHRIDR